MTSGRRAKAWSPSAGFLADHCEPTELLGIRPEDLVSPDWRLTQELGRKIREAGFEAALVPSAATSGTNLALFLDRLQPASSVQLSDLEPIEV